MRRKPVVNAAVAAVVGLVAVWIGTAALGDDKGTVDGPVIVADWNGYPTAEISGELRLVEGCLLIDRSVVFWGEGTGWDAANEAVVFEDADPVQVGSEFSGGGGVYSGGDVDGLDGVDSEAINTCLRRTGSSGAVIATAFR